MAVCPCLARGRAPLRKLLAAVYQGQLRGDETLLTPADFGGAVRFVNSASSKTFAAALREGHPLHGLVAPGDRFLLNGEHAFILGPAYTADGSLHPADHYDVLDVARLTRDWRAFQRLAEEGEERERVRKEAERVTRLDAEREAQRVTPSRVQQLEARIRELEAAQGGGA